MIKKYFDWASPKTIKDDEDFLLLTYRKNITKANEVTYYSSDSGWSCMLRVGQMLIANLFYKHEEKSVIEIISLFYDSKMTPFSIQMLTKASKDIYPLKKQYEWYTPCECGHILK